MEYFVVVSGSIEDLKNQVNSKLREGWIAKGDLHIEGSSYSQHLERPRRWQRRFSVVGSGSTLSSELLSGLANGKVAAKAAKPKKSAAAVAEALPSKEDEGIIQADDTVSVEVEEVEEAKAPEMESIKPSENLLESKSGKKKKNENKNKKKSGKKIDSEQEAMEDGKELSPSSADKTLAPVKEIEEAGSDDEKSFSSLEYEEIPVEAVELDNPFTVSGTTSSNELDLGEIPEDAFYDDDSEAKEEWMATGSETEMKPSRLKSLMSGGVTGQDDSGYVKSLKRSSGKTFRKGDKPRF